VEYILHLGILICFYTMLAQSLDLAAGKTGLVSLAHAGFYGIGAYTAAVLAVQFGRSFWIALPIAMLVSALTALLVSLFALRTTDDYFIICTLGVQIVMFSLMNNLMSLTRGPLGISGIPPIQFLDSKITGKTEFFIISLLLTAVMWWLLKNLSRSGFGKTLIAISAMCAAIPGALYAHYIAFIDPSSFTLNESIFILSIVIIGGMGSLKGSFIASSFMVILPEMLRFVGMPDYMAANTRQIIYGFILVVVMMSGGKGISDLFTLRRQRA
jgi:branched-chain amino acid transport system permease protein